MTEETPVSKPKSASRTRTPKTSSESTPSAQKTSAVAAGEKKAPAPISGATKRAAVTDAKKPTATRRKTTATKTAPSVKPTPEEHYHMVQAAAYFIAEKDAFQGCSVDYWLRAEQEIANQLGEATS